MSIPLNIDWQQILLHVLNFIILAGGLYFLLYKPVSGFMKKREEKYGEMDRLAEEKLKNASEKEEEYEKKLSLAQSEIDEMKKNAAKEAENAANAKLEEAEKEKKQIISSAVKSAEAEKEKILCSADSQIEELVSKAVDKIVAQKKGDSFDDFLNSAKGE